MALTLAEAYAVTHQAAKLDRAAYARTLTNNPSADVVGALEDEAASTLTLLGGAGNAAVVTDTQALVIPVTGTYVDTATVTVVDGVVTAIVLS